MNLPFQETKLGDNEFIRVFEQNTDSGDLHWHRDRESRIIESIGDTDWMIQLDNELPKIIKDKVFIPKGMYHRVIKRHGQLIYSTFMSYGSCIHY